MKKLKFRHRGADLIIFKRWNGHSYSLFQALKKRVRIAVLAVSYLYVTMPGEVFAQLQSTDTGMKYELDEIEVSAHRAPVTLSRVARMISVIEAAQIEAAPAASIQDLLEYAMGVDIRQRGPYGIQADVSVRGGSFDQTIILLNGINLSDPQTGHHNLNLPVSLKSIKRIEVLQGPAARVYGPNAFAGAINIVTDVTGDNRINADVSAGGHQLRDVYVSGNVKSGNLQNFLAFNYASSAGYIENTDFDTWNIFYQGNLRTSPGVLDLQLGYSQKAFGSNSFYTPEYPEQFEKTKTTFVSLKMETGEKLHFTPALYWRRHQDRFELFRNEAPSWYAGHNYHLTDVMGINLNSWFNNALGKTSFGAEYRSENIWSNVLGEDMSEEIEVPGETGKFFTKSHSRTIISYFAEHTFFLNRFTASGGFMVNWISDLNLDWNIYPGVDLSYRITDRLRVTGSLNRSLRMPTFTDLYYEGPSNKGNPDLKPERSITLEGGFRFSNFFMQGQAGYYHRINKDMIDWVHESEDYLWETRNLTGLTADGVEVMVDFDVDNMLKRKTFLNHVGLNYAFNYLKKDDSEYLSYYQMDYLKHKLVIELDHNLLKNICASWKFRFQDRNGGFDLFEDEVFTGETEYKPFWLTDVKCRYKSKGVQVYASVFNLFNKNYVDIGNIKQPGRWLSCGISYTLK